MQIAFQYFVTDQKEKRVPSLRPWSVTYRLVAEPSLIASADQSPP
jgi:hypothetical protein